MNSIKIEYSYFREDVFIEVNGEPLDIFDESLNVLRKEFHLYAPSFFKILDLYFKNPYIVEFSGLKYQISCLETLQKDAMYCHQIKTNEIQCSTAEEELLHELKELQKRYNIQIDNNTEVTVCAAEAQNAADGDICLCSPDTIPEVFSQKILVCLSNKYAIYRAGEQYIAEIPEDVKQQFIDYYRFTHKLNPYLCSLIEKLRSQKLSREDSACLKALRTGIPQYVIGGIPSAMDVGEQSEITFKIYPHTAGNAYTLKSSNVMALTLEGTCLHAVDGGISELVVEDKSGSKVEAFSVQIKKHEYVQSIRLVASFQYLKVKESGQIDAYMLPENAEDSDALKWTSSNTDIVQVMKGGKVIAFKPGKCIITVSSKNVKSSLELWVREEITSISLSDTSVTLAQGETCRLQCIVFPENAIDDDIEWTVSNELLGTMHISQDNKSCSFTPHAGKSGNCTISCTTSNGKIGESCAVNIEPPENHDALYTCAILFTVLGCVALSWLIILLGFIGYLMSLCVPTILCLIGISHNDPKYNFKSLLAINIIVSIVFLFLHVACCGV